MENIGLLIALTLLIYLALKGINVILASLICAVIVALTNHLSISDALMNHYATGPLGLFSFAGKFFLLFICGAIFGRTMSESYAATSIALFFQRLWGPEKTLWIIMSVCALLTYGGVVVFIVIFTVYPLGLELIRSANIPKRLLCGAFMLGSGTFTMTALPGTPSIHNVISASALGTDLFAGGWLGVIASVLMVVMGMFYLERERKNAALNNEGFIPSNDEIIQKADIKGIVPHPFTAFLPLLIVILTIMLPRLLLQLDSTWLESDSLTGQILQFSKSQPIFWPSLSLFLGTLLSLFLFKNIRNKALVVLGHGSDDAIMPLMNTAAVIGFGGVVMQTSGFQHFTAFVAAVDLPPLLSMFFSVSAVSGVVGSASGGLQIFMSTQAENYLAMGISPELLHRMATIASGGLDSLPHSGAVIAILTVMRLTHKQAYKDIAVITIVTPIITMFVLIGIVEVFY